MEQVNGLLLGFSIYFAVRFAVIVLVNAQRHRKARKGVYADMATYRPYLREQPDLLNHLIDEARRYGDASTIGLDKTQGDVIHSYRNHGGSQIKVRFTVIMLVLSFMAYLLTL